MVAVGLSTIDLIDWLTVTAMQPHGLLPLCSTHIRGGSTLCLILAISGSYTNIGDWVSKLTVACRCCYLAVAASQSVELTVEDTESRSMLCSTSFHLGLTKTKSAVLPLTSSQFIKQLERLFLTQL